MSSASGSVSFSEDTPLTSKPNSKRFRRLSSTEKFVSGIKKAISAFEYELSRGESDSDSQTISSYGNTQVDFAINQNRHCGNFCSTFVVFIISISFFGTWFFLYHPCTENIDPLKSLEKTSSINSLKYGAVASDHEVCSEVGKRILVDGGNAVDAAVATSLCLGVANPASSGFGGGAFILIHSDTENHKKKVSQGFPPFHDARDTTITYDKEKITEVVDCREIAPSAASKDMFASTPASASSFGGLAVAVPGELKGLELAHARHGKLPWASVVQPAIDLAKDGVPVSSHLAGDIKSAAERTTKSYGEFPRLRSFLTKDDNWETYLKEGELLKNPKLADTLHLVAEVGSDGLYGGQLAEKLVHDVVAEGGILSVDDMANYLPTLRSPLVGSASGFTLVGVPPPSSGGATLIGAARFLSGYASPLAFAPETLSVHRTVEALRHAFAIRMSLCDPDFHSNTATAAVQDLVTGPYMEELRRLTLDNSTSPVHMYGGSKWAQLNNSNGMATEVKDAHEGDRRRHRVLTRPFGYLEDFGTSHLSVIDKNGNAVAITSSINQILGSYVFSNSTGILLGNTMDDFGNPGKSNYYGLEPSEENFIAPGKKPLSSMSPAFVFKKTEGTENTDLGQLTLVVGGSGGPKIITSVLQVIINYCMLGMSLFDAVARPRIHDQLIYHGAAVTTTEKDKLAQGPLLEVSKITKDALLKRGHKTLLEIDYAGTVQAVSVDLETNTLSAVSDIRKGGKPAGF